VFSVWKGCRDVARSSCALKLVHLLFTFSIKSSKSSATHQVLKFFLSVTITRVVEHHRGQSIGLRPHHAFRWWSSLPTLTCADKCQRQKRGVNVTLVRIPSYARLGRNRSRAASKAGARSQRASHVLQSK
jgi:hypothetical protein